VICSPCSAILCCTSYFVPGSSMTLSRYPDLRAAHDGDARMLTLFYTTDCGLQHPVAQNRELAKTWHVHACT
jgi:hypothetical protein